MCWVQCAAPLVTSWRAGTDFGSIESGLAGHRRSPRRLYLKAVWPKHISMMKTRSIGYRWVDSGIGYLGIGA